MELYKNIKRLRIERGMTQDELAQKTGYNNRSSIAKIEQGQVDLTLSKIMIFANALGVPAMELMGWSETPSNVVELKKEEPPLLGGFCFSEKKYWGAFAPLCG